MSQNFVYYPRSGLFGDELLQLALCALHVSLSDQQLGFFLPSRAQPQHRHSLMACDSGVCGSNAETVFDCWRFSGINGYNCKSSSNMSTRKSVRVLVNVAEEPFTPPGDCQSSCTVLLHNLLLLFFILSFRFNRIHSFGEGNSDGFATLCRKLSSFSIVVAKVEEDCPALTLEEQSVSSPSLSSYYSSRSRIVTPMP